VFAMKSSWLIPAGRREGRISQACK
jgi:hypothetical protein